MTANSTEPPNAPSYDRAMVGWLSLAQLITWGSVFYTFALLMEPVERELGLSRAQSSLAFSLALLAEGLLAFSLGRLIDRGHERAVMTLGSVLVAICLAAHTQVQTLSGFYAVWALMGAGLAATLYNPVFAVITRRFPREYRRAIITLTFLGGLASTVFIPLSAWLIQSLGWRDALWVLAGLNLLVCAPIHAVNLRGAPKAVPPSGPAARGADKDLQTHLRSRTFLLVGVFVVLMMAVTAALPAHMVSLLRESGMSEAWALIIPASIGLIQVLGRLVLYFYEHRMDLHLSNRLIPILIPLGLVALLASGGQVAAALLFVLLFGLGNGMLTIVKGTVIAEYVSRAHVASLNGALGLPLAIARAAAPLSLGLLWSPTAGYAWGLWGLLLASVVAVAALMLAQGFAQTERR